MFDSRPYEHMLISGAGLIPVCSLSGRVSYPVKRCLVQASLLLFLYLKKHDRKVAFGFQFLY
jgi:hypothetical protein